MRGRNKIGLDFYTFTLKEDLVYIRLPGGRFDAMWLSAFDARSGTLNISNAATVAINAHRL